MDAADGRGSGPCRQARSEGARRRPIGRGKLMTVKRRIRLGEMLVETGAITEEQLQAALAEQRRSGRKLGRGLADLGLMSDSSLHEFLSKHLQVPFVDLKTARVGREGVDLV